jgi:hypothetical protein
MTDLLLPIFGAAEDPPVWAANRQQASVSHGAMISSWTCIQAVPTVAITRIQPIISFPSLWAESIRFQVAVSATAGSDTRLKRLYPIFSQRSTFTLLAMGCGCVCRLVGGNVHSTKTARPMTSLQNRVGSDSCSPTRLWRSTRKLGF